MVDLDRGLLLDVVQGRSGKVVGDWLDTRSEQWKAQITVAAIDAFRGYANALAAGLPTAMLVMDCFHTVALANRAVDRVRRRVQNETLGHRGRRDDPLYRVRRLTLVGAGRLNERGWTKLLAGIELGDPTGHLGAAWIAKEEIRRVYSATGPEAARRALTRFYTHCADCGDVPEVLTLARTVSAWEPQILAYHHTAGASNGPTEAVNLLIEKTRRIGHGFPQLRQLPAPPIARLRPQMASSTSRTNPRTTTTLRRVEPVYRALLSDAQRPAGHSAEQDHAAAA